MLELQDILSEYQIREGHLYPREMLRVVALVLGHVQASDSAGALGKLVRSSKHIAEAGGKRGRSDPLAVAKVCSLFPQDIVPISDMERLLKIMNRVAEDQELYDGWVDDQDWFGGWPHSFEEDHIRDILSKCDQESKSEGASEGLSFMLSRLPRLEDGAVEIDRTELYTALAFWLGIRDKVILLDNDPDVESSSNVDSENPVAPIWMDGTEFQDYCSVEQQAIKCMADVAMQIFVGDEECALYGLTCVHELTKAVSPLSPKIVTRTVGRTGSEYELWMDATPESVQVSPSSGLIWDMSGPKSMPRLTRGGSVLMGTRVSVGNVLGGGVLSGSESIVPRFSVKDQDGWLVLPLRCVRLQKDSIAEWIETRDKMKEAYSPDEKDLFICAFTGGSPRLIAWLQAFTHHWSASMLLARERLEQKHRRLLNNLVVGMRKAVTLNDVTEVVTSKVCEILKCERGTILIKEELGDHLWAPISDMLPVGLKVAIGRGIAGIVATTGESYTCNSPLSDENWEGARYNDFSTRNLITVPVLHEWRKTTQKSKGLKVVAVLQALNKCSIGTPACLKMDDVIFGFGGRAFLNQWTERDLLYLRKISEKVSEEFVERLPQLLGAKVLLDVQDEMMAQSTVLSLLSAYYTTSPVKQPQHEGQMSRRLTADKPQQRAVTQYRATAWEIPYWDMGHADQLAFAWEGFHLCDCANMIVEMVPFVAFFNQIRAGYRSTNLYHNFDHALQTFHCSVLYLLEAFPQVKKGSENRAWPIFEMERLCILVAALGHDIDHPGRNNHFEISTQSELARLYNDYSVLEMHHCAVLTKLLRENDFLSLEGLGSDGTQFFRQLLVKSVLGTDMALHGQHVKTAESLPDAATWGEDTAFRSHTVVLLVHAADVGAQTLPPTIANTFGDRVMAEFTQQAEREQELGIPVTPYMQGLEPSNHSTRGSSQLGFIDYVVAPFWNALARPFPLLTTPMKNMRVNRETFVNWVEEGKKRRNSMKTEPVTPTT